VGGVAVLAYCLWREDHAAHELTWSPADEEGKL
jgi:hypothetical protein